MGAKITVDYLKSFRRRIRVSLLELAAYTGLPEGYLEKIENEEVMVSEADLKRIERALRMFQANAEQDHDVTEI